MFCVEVIGFKVAKSPPTRVNARENAGPETGIPVGRAYIVIAKSLILSSWKTHQDWLPTFFRLELVACSTKTTVACIAQIANGKGSKNMLCKLP